MILGKSVFLFLISILLFCPLEHQAQEKILVLGDSNGASKVGWVVQLQRMYPEKVFINTSISGNTIGYNNLGRKQLNTLHNLPLHLEKIRSEHGRLNYVLILLGTNDCKAVFQDSLAFTIENMDKLVQEIGMQARDLGRPEIVIISLPPYGSNEILKAKYHNGDSCVQQLMPEFQRIAKKHQAMYLDIYSKMKPKMKALSTDGVHFKEKGYKRIAKQIARQLWAKG